jgi:hypothetical protein
MNKILRSLTSRSFIPLKQRPLNAHRTPSKFIPFRSIMNSATSSYQTSFGTSGNLGIAPKQMSQLQNLKLNDGNEIPVLGYGLGTANYKSNSDGPLDKNIVETTVMAIKAGYYHLDGAQGTD